VNLYVRLPHGRTPRGRATYVLSDQALRSGTSVGAHYREGRRARSTAEFISKIESALQELDETAYWLELLIESGIVKAKLLEGLLQETDELIRIFVKSVRTAKGEN
jgi:four helix bundle protein